MADPTVIHFVRHGDVQNPQAVYYGRSPGFPLSEKGYRQAQYTADALRHKPLVAIFSSPLLRATETAEIILALHNSLTLRISEYLNEAYTPFDGRPVSEVAERDWDVYTGNEPPYEQSVDVLARAQQFIAEVRQQYVGQHVVAVTHGDVIAFMMLWAKGMPITPKHKQVLYQGYLAPASITTFVYQTRVSNEVPSIEYVKPY
jgi:broad specificity phosphatase PhoE